MPTDATPQNRLLLPAFGALVALGMAVVLAFFAAIAMPPALHLAADVACPSGTVSNRVVATDFVEADGTSTTLDLYCQDGHGTRTRMPLWRVMAGILPWVLAVQLPFALRRRFWLQALALGVGAVLLGVLPSEPAQKQGEFDADGGEFLSGQGPAKLRARLAAELGGDPRLVNIDIWGTRAHGSAVLPGPVLAVDTFWLSSEGYFKRSPSPDPAADVAEKAFTFEQITSKTLPERLRACADSLGARADNGYVTVARRGDRVEVGVHCSSPRHSTYQQYDGQGQRIDRLAPTPAPTSPPSAVPRPTNLPNSRRIVPEETLNGNTL